MVPLQIPGFPELAIIVMIVMIPGAFLFIAYKIFRGYQTFQEGQRQS